jgi:ATPase subunit of ABC transporter with duplicated ATPase domains
VLEDGRIADFAGSFAEWEEVRREREAAAAALAAEEAARQMEAERGKARRTEASRQTRGADHRQARRALEEIEARISELETREGALSGELEDPLLYETSEGSMRALELQAELEGVRRELEEAIAEWEGAAELAG